MRWKPFVKTLLSNVCTASGQVTAARMKGLGNWSVRRALCPAAKQDLAKSLAVWRAFYGNCAG